jgi:hypothetical protein
MDCFVGPNDIKINRKRLFLQRLLKLYYPCLILSITEYIATSRFVKLWALMRACGTRFPNRSSCTATLQSIKFLMNPQPQFVKSNRRNRPFGQREPIWKWGSRKGRNQRRSGRRSWSIPRGPGHEDLVGEGGGAGARGGGVGCVLRRRLKPPHRRRSRRHLRGSCVLSVASPGLKLRDPVGDSQRNFLRRDG